MPERRGPGLVNRGHEATGGAIKREPSVLPGRALTQTCQPLHVAPHRTGIRLVRLRQVVRLAGVLLRQLESLHDRVNNRVTRRSELLGRGPQKNETIVRGIGIEGGPNAFERSRPGLLNRCTHVSAPEAGHVLKAPDDVISTNLPKEKHIKSKGGGTDVTVPENESAELTGVRGRYRRPG